MQIGMFEVKPVSIVKFTVSLIVGMGTRTLVNNFIENNTPPEETRTRRFTSNAAGTVVGLMAVERTKAWTDAKIDRLFDSWYEADKQIDAIVIAEADPQ